MNTNKQTTLPDKDAQSVAEERNTTTKNNQTSQLNDNKKDESKTRRVMLHEKQNLKDLELERSSTNKTTTPTHSFRPVSQFSPGGPLLAPLHIDLPPIPSPSPTSHIHAIVPQSPTVESENTSSPMEGIVQEKKTKSRKEKSLNVLCDRFINHYKQRSNGQPLEFQLDQATAELGVEKRRIYDIVNVLESINIVKKRAVSMFTWNGFNGLNDTLRVLRIDGIKDATLYDGISTLSDEKENAPLRDAMKKFNPTREAKSSKTEKGEKLLMQLSQKFIQLFLVTQLKSFTHDQAVQILIKNQEISESGERTKIRRLNDIANILSSVNLIQKGYTSDYKKQICFEWIGTNLESFSDALPVPTIDVTRATSPQLVSAQVPLKKRKIPSVTTPVTPVTPVSPSDTKTDNTKQPIERKRSSLNFQFRSPPAKRSKITPEERTVIPTTQRTMISKNMTVAPLQKQPLSNITNRVGNEINVTKGTSLSFKFSSPDIKRDSVQRSQSFKIGEKISVSTYEPKLVKLDKAPTVPVRPPAPPQVLVPPNPLLCDVRSLPMLMQQQRIPTPVMLVPIIMPTTNANHDATKELSHNNKNK